VNGKVSIKYHWVFWLFLQFYSITFSLKKFWYNFLRNRTIFGWDKTQMLPNKTKLNRTSLQLNDIKIEWDTNKLKDLRHHRIETNAIVNEMKHEQSELWKSQVSLMPDSYTQQWSHRKITLSIATLSFMTQSKRTWA